MVQPVSLATRTKRVNHLNFGLNLEMYHYQQVYSIKRKTIAVHILISASISSESAEPYMTCPTLLFHASRQGGIDTLGLLRSPSHPFPSPHSCFNSIPVVEPDESLPNPPSQPSHRT